jgi:hypothetical protein
MRIANMNEHFTQKALEELVNSVKMATSHNYRLIFTPNVWLRELKRNPQYFSRNDRGELLYSGYKVETIITSSDTGHRFWYMADKIIPKESNNND